MKRPQRRQPVVISSDHRFIEAIPVGDYIGEQYLDFSSSAITVLSEVIVQQLSNSITGQTYTQDYPHRHEITGSRFVTSPKVDNLVQGPVEIVPGTWKLGYAVDDRDQDRGTYPAYIYEIAQSAVTDHRLAIDYFRTWTLRNGTKQYWYTGTAYFAAQNDSSNFRLFSLTKNEGFGTILLNTDPENPSPEDVVSTEFYVVPRKLKPGEQVQNLITTTNGWVSGATYFDAIRKSPLLA